MKSTHILNLYIRLFCKWANYLLNLFEIRFKQFIASGPAGDNRETQVSADGAWQKRGSNSLSGELFNIVSYSSNFSLK